MSNKDPEDQESVDCGIEPLDIDNPWSYGLDDFREALGDLTFEAITNDEQNLLLEIPAGGGKSYSAKETIAETAAHQQYFYGTNKHENREEREEKIRELNDNLTISRFPDSKLCPVFSDKDEYEDVNCEKLVIGRNHGMSLKEAHAHIDEQIEAHEPDNQCDFTRNYPDQQEKDASHVLIGNHHHARALDNVEGRRVVLDESTGMKDAHTTVFGHGDERHSIPETITSVIEDYENTDINSWGEFLEASTDDDKKDNDDLAQLIANLYEDTNGTFRIDNPLDYFNDETYPHVLTPLVLRVIGINDPKRLGKDYKFETDDVIIIVKPHKDKQDTIKLIEKSDLTKVAKSVTALDASDKLGWWERYYGIESVTALKNESLLSYLDIAFNDLRLLSPSDRDGPGARPYNGNNVTPIMDGGMIRLIKQKHGKVPGVITTKNALDEYEKKSHPDYQVIPGIDRELTEEMDTMHHGMIRSNRDFENRDVITVIGSNHLPENEIVDECLIRGIKPEINDGKGETWTGDTGKVRNALLEQDTMQALTRGRKSTPDDDGAIVYVNSDTIPEEFDEAFTEWEFDNELLNSRVRQQTFDAILDLDVSELVQLGDAEKCQKIVLQSPYSTINEMQHNMREMFGFEKPMINDEVGCNRSSVKRIFDHFQEKGLVEKVKESAGPNPAIWQYKGVEKCFHKKKSSDKQTKTRVDNPYKKAYLNANNDNNNQKNQQEQHSNNNSEEKSQSKIEELKEQNQEFMEKQREKQKQYKKELREMRSGGGTKMRTDGGTNPSQDTDKEEVEEIITDDMPKDEKDRLKLGVTSEELRR